MEFEGDFILSHHKEIIGTYNIVRQINQIICECKYTTGTPTLHTFEISTFASDAHSKEKNIPHLRSPLITGD